MAKIVKSDLRYSIEWRDSIKFIDYGYEEFVKFLSETDKEYIYSEKLDGELNSLIYEKDKYPYFLTKNGVVHERDYSVLREYKNILDSLEHINDIVVIGELKAFSPEKDIEFRKSQSIIRTGDEDLIHHFPFDIYRLNGENTHSDLVSLREMFKSDHIRTPRFSYGGVDVFKEVWDSIVNQEHGEGIVVIDTMDLNIRYRIKNIMTADVVILGAGNTSGKAWAKNQVGYLILALLDENNDFILTTKLGTGLNKKEKLELFEYVYNNKVEEKGGDIWIPPTLIAEVKYRRHRFQKLPLIKYIDDKYINIGDTIGVMMDQASLSRFRDDKRIDYKDLSINQFPMN